MSEQQTRVTKIWKLEDRLKPGTENCLVQIHGPELGRKYILDEDEFTIGRDVKNNIVVNLDNVSRRHAKISTRNGKAYLSDVGSTNGTYLNESEVLEETPIR